MLLSALLLLLFILCSEATRMVHMNQRWDVFRPNKGANAAVDTDAYIMFKAFYKSSSYIQAEEHCRQYNAHLASFHSEQEFKFIAEITQRFYGWAYNDFWLGLFHRGELLPEVPNYRLYFVDSSAYNNTEFSSTEERHSKFWMRHLDKWNSYRFEPDHFAKASLNQSSSEYCVAISHVGYKLFDLNCSTPSSFVCRYEGKAVEGVDNHGLASSQPIQTTAAYKRLQTAAVAVESVEGALSGQSDSSDSVPDVSSKLEGRLFAADTSFHPSFVLSNNTWMVFMVVDGNNTNGIVSAAVFMAAFAVVFCVALPILVLASLVCRLKGLRKKHYGVYCPSRNV